MAHGHKYIYLPLSFVQLKPALNNKDIFTVEYEGGSKNNRNRPVAHACFLVTSCVSWRSPATVSKLGSVLS
jgi:hypothetical protein